LKKKIVQKIIGDYKLSMAKFTNPCQLYRKAINQFQNSFPKILDDFSKFCSLYFEKWQ